jgi:hypothetical protein
VELAEGCGRSLTGLRDDPACEEAVRLILTLLLLVAVVERWALELTTLPPLSLGEMLLLGALLDCKVAMALLEAPSAPVWRPVGVNTCTETEAETDTVGGGDPDWTEADTETEAETDTVGGGDPDWTEARVEVDGLGDTLSVGDDDALIEGSACSALEALAPGIQIALAAAHTTPGSGHSKEPWYPGGPATKPASVHRIDAASPCDVEPCSSTVNSCDPSGRELQWDSMHRGVVAAGEEPTA